MIYRATVFVIVAFWLLMMGMLVRVEFATNESDLLPVPPEYVWKLMFLHDQTSDLVLFNQHRRLGSFHLQPRRLPTGTDGTGGPIRLLSGSGGLSLSLPGVNAQSVVLRGSLELDERDAVQRFELNVNFHELHQPLPGLTLVLDGRPVLDQWHYLLRRGDAVLQENAGPPSILLDALDLHSLGVDPKAILEMGRQQSGTLKTTARRGTLHTNGEDIEAFVVTIRQSDSLETSIYVSQLGQILAVKTFAGYDLYDDSLTP